jgi:hypothetical protein
MARGPGPSIFLLENNSLMMDNPGIFADKTLHSSKINAQSSFFPNKPLVLKK